MAFELKLKLNFFGVFRIWDFEFGVATRSEEAELLELLEKYYTAGAGQHLGAGQRSAFSLKKFK